MRIRDYYKQEDVRKAIYVRIVSGIVLAVVSGVITALAFALID